LNLPEILKSKKTKKDLFRLPQEALEIIFGHSATCLSEYSLFKAITERLTNVGAESSSYSCVVGEELKEIREEVNSKQSEE